MTSKDCFHDKITARGVVSELRTVCAKVLSLAQGLDYLDDDLFAIHLALEEAVVNAVKHGNKRDPSRDVIIEYELSPEKVDIRVTDQGRGFNPGGLADPRVGENIYKTSGRGVLLIRSYMDSVEYNNTGNSVRMVKLNSKYARV